MKSSKILALAAALLMCGAVLSGCSKDNGQSSSETSASEEAAPSTEVIEIKTHALEDGDVAAIRKFSVSDLGAYTLSTETENGKLFLGEKSQIEVMALNYKEDLDLDIAAFADSACASIKVTNMLYKTDTEFSEPSQAKIAGFDAVMYDYTLTQNVWLDANGNIDTENGTKTAVGFFKSRAYFFYSDKDAYYAIFTTDVDTWDECLPDFQSFMSNVFIDENALPAETEATENDDEIVATGEEIAEEDTDSMDDVEAVTETNEAGEEVIAE